MGDDLSDFAQVLAELGATTLERDEYKLLHEECTAELQAANAKVESLDVECQALREELQSKLYGLGIQQQYDAQQGRIHSLEEALRFYADPDHWAEYRGTLQPHFYFTVKEIHRPWDVAAEAIRGLRTARNLWRG